MNPDRHAITADPAAAEPAAPLVRPTLDPARVEPASLPGAPHIEGYRILAKIGQGGMGTVWRAVQLSTRREVALKLLAIAPGSGKKKARFEREVELAAMLEHPNLARVYDSGAEQGWYYYAMELIEGMHLDTFVNTNRYNKRQIIELMSTICRAIQVAHQRGVIHRDLKPSNILVTSDGQPHVVDFGLAKTLMESDSEVPISIDGDVAGTPAYMSPEQAAGRVSQVDTRSDVYSLGVILYQLLTGSTPHDTSGTSYQVLKRIIEQEPRTPRSVSRMVDRELEALLMKALAREPERRYPSAGELASDLENYLRGDPLTAKQPTFAYFLLKRARKYSVPLASFGSIAFILASYSSWMYMRPVTIPVDSNPGHAKVYVDGVEQACCTPTQVKLSFGRHVVKFEPPPGFVDIQPQREIKVEWGKATGMGPVVFAPNFQTVIFKTEPTGARVEIRDGKTKQLITTLTTTDYVARLPTNFYEAIISKEGYQPIRETIDIRGSADALIIDREFTPLSNAPAK